MRGSRLLTAVFGAASLMACSSATREGTIRPSAHPGSMEVVMVQVVERGRSLIRTMNLEDYVRGTVLAEFTTASDEADVVRRMLELQAIASRTYAIAHKGRHRREGFDFCSTVHCQIFDPDRLQTSKWGGEASQAVSRTAGQVVWYEGGPAEVLYHADCGGHTATASDIWGGPGPPYLRAQADRIGTHLSWRYVIRLEDVRRALNADPLTAVGERLDELEIVTRDGSGRAMLLRLIGNHTRLINGEGFRRVVTRSLGAQSIRSTLFTITRDGGVLTFSGRGFGHGVGLCQAGALGRLRGGDPPEAVLVHYFPGTRLRRLLGGS